MKSSRSRGFAVNPELDFHREGAKHAKKTRRTLVWLRLCCSVVPFILLVAAGLDRVHPCPSLKISSSSSARIALPHLRTIVVSDGEMEQRTGLRRNLRADRRRNRLGSPGHIRRARCAEGR